MHFYQSRLKHVFLSSILKMSLNTIICSVNKSSKYDQGYYCYQHNLPLFNMLHSRKVKNKPKNKEHQPNKPTLIKIILLGYKLLTLYFQIKPLWRGHIDVVFGYN